MTTTAIIAAGEARAAHVATQPRTQLIRGVDMDEQECTDCEGSGVTHQTERYCTCSAGIELLRHAFQPPAPADPVRDALVRAVQEYKDRSDEYFSLATDRGGHSGPKGKAFIAMGGAYKAMTAALALAKGEKP